MSSSLVTVLKNVAILTIVSTSGIPWSISKSPSGSVSYCLCYKEKVNGVFQEVTTCRKTLKNCLKLGAKVKTGSQLLKKDSRFVPCTQVLGESPTLTLGHITKWKKSKKAGNHFYPHACLLKKDTLPLKWISVDGVYNLDKALIPQRIRELFFNREMSGKEVSPHQFKELPKSWTVVTAEGVIKTSSSTIEVDEDGVRPTYRYIMQKEYAQPLMMYPTDLFPKEPRIKVLKGKRLSTNRQERSKHFLSEKTYQALIDNLDKEFLEKKERDNPSTKTFCNKNNMQVFEILVQGPMPYVLYCEAKEDTPEYYSRKERKLIKVLRRKVNSDLNSDLFTGLFLYDGKSTVESVEFMSYNDYGGGLGVPTVAVDFEHQGYYHVIYPSYYHEGYSVKIFTTKRGYVESWVIFEQG